MAKKNGSEIFIKIGDVVLTGQTSTSFKWNTDTPECTTKDSNGHKEYLAGEDGGTVDFAFLYDPSGTYSYAELLTAQKAKTAVTFKVGGVVAGDEIITGSGFINSSTQNGPKNAPVDCSGTIQITGDVTQTVVTDATAPFLEAAYVNNATPTILRMKFSEDLDPAYSVAGTAWSASGSSSGAKTVSSTQITGQYIYLTMDEAYVAADTITVAYTAPGGAQDIRDKSGNLLASFTAEAVTNNVQ